VPAEDAAITKFYTPSNSTEVREQEVDSDLGATFIFQAGSDSLAPAVCFKFGIEPFQRFADVAVKVGEVKGAVSRSGDVTIAVVDHKKPMVFFGGHQAVNDTVKWIRSGTDCITTDTAIVAELLATVSGNSITQLSEAQANKLQKRASGVFAFTFATSTSGAEVSLCYKFADEPFRHYPLMKLAVRMLHQIDVVGNGDISTAVANVQKNLIFTGDGVAAMDYAKWVDFSQIGYDCDSPGVSLFIADDGADDAQSNAMALKVVDEPMIKGKTSALAIFEFLNNAQGSPWVLCYRFDQEPYHKYSDYTMAVKGVKGFGALGTAAVVNMTKSLQLEGTGAQAGDRLRWVDAGTVSTDGCLSGASVTTSVGGVESVGDNGALTLTFTTSGNFKLCYGFGTEDLVLYKGVQIEVQDLTSVQAVAGSATLAVVGYPKELILGGVGFQEGDKAKWVSLNVDTDANCGTDAQNAEPGTGGELIVAAPEGGEAGKLAITSTFEIASAEQRPYQLCYKFGDEPYKLYSAVQVEVRQVESIERSEVVVGVSYNIAFVGFGVMTDDRAFFTPAGNINCQDYQRSSTIGKLQFTVAPIVFTKPSQGKLTLCYAFADEPYMHYPTIEVASIKPYISYIAGGRAATTVVGVTKSISLTGTFGLTSEDALKLVSNNAGSCDAVGEGVNSVSYPNELISITSSSVGQTAETGIATVALLFSSNSPDGQPWKLCYRFGSDTNPLSPFFDLTVAAAAITALIVDAGGGTTGEPMIVTFAGSGIRDGDKAKWVGGIEDTDAACAREPVSGSSEIVVAASSATFYFTTGLDDFRLCYQFGAEPYKLYPSGTLAITKAGEPEAPPSSSENEANLSMSLDEDYDTIVNDPAKQAALSTDFRAYMAGLLGIHVSLISITGFTRGSIIINFVIRSSGSSADPLLTETITLLQKLFANLQSALYTGILSKLDGSVPLAIAITETAAPAPVPSLILDVQEVKTGGLFVFESSVYAVTEFESSITVAVIRNQGSEGHLVVTYESVAVGSTATAGVDYVAAIGTLNFGPGEVRKTFDITVLDDDVKEAHYETLKLKLSVPVLPNAAAGKMFEAVVRIYDYGDGEVITSASFGATNPYALEGEGANQVYATACSNSKCAHTAIGQDVSSTSTAVVLDADGSSSAVAAAAQGWSVVGNGQYEAAYVDGHGMFAADELYAADEYDARCDYASPTEPCDYSCKYGGGYAATNPKTGRSSGVLALDGNSYASSSRAVEEWPTDVITVSFWVRAPTSASTTGTLLSYVDPARQYDSSSGDNSGLAIPFQSFALVDPTNVRVLINTHTSNMGLRTGVNVADGEWHFLSFTWRSADGQVQAYKDGALLFQGGPFRTGVKLPQGGSVMLGQMQSAACADASSSAAPLCHPADAAQYGFTGELQNMRVWGRLLSNKELLHGMHWPFTGSQLKLALYWRFETQHVLSTDQNGGQYIKDLSGQGASSRADGNTAYISNSSSSIHGIAPGTPSINSAYPCGEVYSNIWHFSAPASFTRSGDLSTGYGGRLQYRLYSPSHNGRVRNRRGSVVLFGANGLEISCPVSLFPTPGDDAWSSYSVILREDHGWIMEPKGGAITTLEMKEVLRNVTSLLVRGDQWVYDTSGYGQEVTYINDITVFSA